MKHCTGCDTSKALDEFNSDVSRPDKHAAYCKDCNRKRLCNYYARNRDALQAQAALRRADNSEKCREAVRRCRANKKGQ